MSLHVVAAVRERDVEVELRVEPGETVALLGPNGSGKSTLLAVIAGLLDPDTGSARLAGRTLFDIARPGSTRAARWRSLPPHDRGVSLLSQDALLFPHLDVRDNVAFGPRSHGHSARESRRRADRWLERVGATELADRTPGRLSGGQAQRVALARALAVDPALLLLDEPMAALDASTAPAMRRLLREVTRDRMTVVVTHDVLDALVLADRVALIDGGRIIGEGPTREVLAHPSTAFAARLTGVNLLTGRWRDGALHTDDGHRILATRARSIADGASAGVSVRPTHVAVAAVPDAQARDAQGRDAQARDAQARDTRTAGQDASPRSDPTTDAVTVLTATVTDLEPHGDTVRVRAGEFAADVPPSVVADLDLMPGSQARFSFAAADANAYPL